MALPSVASSADIQTLIDNIQHASNAYSPHTDSVTSLAQRAAIRSAATQLLHAVTTPDEMVWKKSMAMTELVVLRTAMRLGIFAALPVDAAISNSSLASKVNATTSLVERLMRVLVGTGFCDQLPIGDSDDDNNNNDAEPRYKHTKFSLGFTSTDVPSPGTFYQGVYDTYLRSSVNFDTWMLDHPTSTGLYGDPASNTVNPYVSHFNPNPDTVATTWEVMPLYPDELRVCQMCLQAMNEIIPPTGPFYDFSQFGTDADSSTDASADAGRVQLVDVGGGYGRVLTEILTAHPRLDPTRCVLQDVPDVIAMADTAQVRTLGVQTMPIDFFDAQPVKGK